MQNKFCAYKLLVNETQLTAVISEQDKLTAVISLSTFIILKNVPRYQRIIFWPPIYREGNAL